MPFLQVERAKPIQYTHSHKSYIMCVNSSVSLSIINPFALHACFSGECLSNTNKEGKKAARSMHARSQLSYCHVCLAVHSHVHVHISIKEKQVHVFKMERLFFKYRGAFNLVYVFFGKDFL